MNELDLGFSRDRMEHVEVCSNCGRQFDREHGRWISGLPLCLECIAEFQREKLIMPSKEHPKVFLLTEAGERKFPGLNLVGCCGLDGSPIYQKWVAAGLAEIGEHPRCPCCLGKMNEAMRCKVFRYG